MGDVFVSYVGPDREAARPILEGLRAAGLSVADDQTLPPGADFARKVEAATEEANCFLVVWSETAARSSWVAKDMRLVMRAWSSDRLVLAALDDAALPVGLRDIPPVRVGQDASGVVARVKAVVERTRAAPAAAPLHAVPGARGAGGALLAAFVVAALAAAGAIGFSIWQESAAPQSQPEVHRELRPGAAAPSLPDLAPAPGPAPAPARPPGAGTGSALGALEPLAVLIAGVLIVGVLIGAGLAWAIASRARSRAAPRSVAALAPAPAGAPAAAGLSGGLQVFVSYSRKDERVVDDLVRKIEAMGYPVWIDREAIGSARYAGQIVGAIRTSQLVALMGSKSAFASDHVIREVYVAGDFKKPFVAFQLDPTDFPDDILYFVTGFPRIAVEGATVEALRAEFVRAAGARG